MNSILRTHAEQIARGAIAAVLPDAAVKAALENTNFPGRVILIAVGKAAWQMAKSAKEYLRDTVCDGIVITKYDHVKAPILGLRCFEAGHPVPDENTYRATEEAIATVKNLTADDTVLFLLSGGGSALFEKPLIPESELQDITDQLLASGADIVEMNTIRKRLSCVKGGRFAELCKPAHVFAIVLSDILGDRLDMIASGPVSADTSTCAQALAIAEKYNLRISEKVRACLVAETPKQINNVTAQITGSVRQLCDHAKRQAEAFGYEAIVLTDALCCEAKEAGSFLSSVIKDYVKTKKQLAFIAGGETVVKLTGSGKGGRNQELALSAAIGLDGIQNAAVISVGSDGTDGPTDAAGGYVDGNTAAALREKGVSIYNVLADNDAYYALKAVDGLIFTGPTGTNVNDVAIALILPDENSAG